MAISTSTTTLPDLRSAVSAHWFVYVFLLVFFSIWNSVCSAFLYPSLQRIVNGDRMGFVYGFCTCLLPHLPIGVVVPFIAGGSRFCLVAMWPYYMAALAAYQSRERGEPWRQGGPGALVRDISRSHNTVVPTLRRMYSGGAAKFPDRYRLARESLASDHAECAICFEALCIAPVCCLVDGTCRRSCPHFFHQACIQEMIQSGSQLCPLCRRPFQGKQRLPQAGEEPKAWFELVNLSGSGSVSQKELLGALKAVLPLKAGVMESKVQEAFGTHNYLSFHEIMKPETGIYAFIVKFWAQAAGEMQPVPSLRRTSSADRRALFDSWDTTESGRIDVAEVYRGCVQTFGVTVSMEADVYETYLEIDNTFGESGGIAYKDFAQKGGLLDLLLTRLGKEWPVASPKLQSPDQELQNLVGRNAV